MGLAGHAADGARRPTLRQGPPEIRQLYLPWNAFGATRDKPDLGWLLKISVAEPIGQRTWLILDRLGIETPDFAANPKLEPQTGPDATISSNDILSSVRFCAGFCRAP